MKNKVFTVSNTETGANGDGYTSKRWKTGNSGGRNRSGKNEDSHVETWENKLESQDPIAKVTAMMEKPKIIEADQKRIKFLNMKVIDETANEDTWKKYLKLKMPLRNEFWLLKKRLDDMQETQKECVKNWNRI